MTAARHDFAHPVQPAAPVGEWPVAPRFMTLPAASATLATVPAPAVDLAEVTDLQAHVEAETLALTAAPQPEAIAVEVPEPEAIAVEVPKPEAIAVEEPEAVAVEPEAEGALTPSPAAGRVIADVEHALTEPVAVTPLPNPPAAPAPVELVAEAPVAPVEPELPVAPEAPVLPEALADAARPAPPAPVAAAPVLPDAPIAPIAPEAPLPPAAPELPAPIELPTVEADWSAHVAPWPLDVVADLLPEDADDGGRRLPPIALPSRNLLAVGLLAGAAGLVAITGLLGGGEEPVAATPAAQTAAADWAKQVPKVLPKGDVDAVTLDEREVRPARTKHQLELAMLAMKPGEVIRELTIRNDGTVMLSVVHGATQRNIVTKGMPPAAPATPASADGTPAPILAIDPIEIDARIPRKLIKAVERAKGVAPTTIKMVRSANARGGQATWMMQWADATGRPTAAIFATPDGHKLAASMAALG